MRNDPSIPQATRDKVLEAARALGYRRDAQVSRLMGYLQKKKKEFETIAYVTAQKKPSLEGDLSYKGFFLGAMECCEELGYRLEEFWLRPGELDEKQLDRILYNRGIRGVILAPHPIPGSTLRLKWERYATVSIGYSLAEPETHRVIGNHYQMILTAYEKVVEAGYKRVGFCLSERTDLRSRHIWLSGYLAERILHGDEADIPPYIGDIKGRGLVKWYEKYLPEVLIMATGLASDSLKSAGYETPRDYACVYLDRQPSGGQQAGIVHHFRSVGFDAVNEISALLHRNELNLPERPRLIMAHGGYWKEGRSLLPKSSAAASKRKSGRR